MAPLSARATRRRPGNTGAVYAEFLVAGMPFFTFFLCLWQLGMLFSAKLMVDHAAQVAARAAAVVIAEPGAFSGDPAFSGPCCIDASQNVATPFHMHIVNAAAELALAPLINAGTIDNVDTQPRDKPVMGNYVLPSLGAPVYDSMIPMTVTATYHCKLPLASIIVCSGSGTRTLAATGIYAYQGSTYTQLYVP